MTKQGFHILFSRALSAAAREIEARLGREIPHSFRIELHAPRSQGRLVSMEEAVDELYLGEDRFYRIIDVAIRRLLPTQTVVFVRVSGHAPAPFNQTWDPNDLGPFRQIFAQTIEDATFASTH